MDDRIHRYLDGELAADELSPDERDVARGFERAMDALREDGARLATTDLAPAVMRRVEASVQRPAGAMNAPDARRSPGRRLLRWLIEKREISLRLRPLPAMAAAAVVLLAMAWGMAPRFDDANPAETAAPTVFVRFELVAPEAESVRLAGSFSGWSPDVALQRTPDGYWSALVPLEPGVHDYAFQIDGERWTVDPAAPRIADGFGGFNSRLSLVLADS